MKHLREIKFRAKETKTGEWVYGFYVSNLDQKYKHSQYIQRYGRMHGNFKKWLIDPETLGQFTGLKDKNGKEIYEGDLVGLNKPDNAWQVDFYTPKAAYVIWSETPYNNFVLTEAFFRRNKVEVIGNIWEHPELLEKPK